MPNGNPDFDPQTLEQWFAPIAGVLTSFVEHNHFLIDRYYHDSPSWTFRFNHPSSGQEPIIGSRELQCRRDRIDLFVLARGRL